MGEEHLILMQKLASCAKSHPKNGMVKYTKKKKKEKEKTASLLSKLAGEKERGVRDGTGPFSGSYRRRMEGKSYGRRLEAGEKCPVTKKELEDVEPNARKKVLKAIENKKAKARLKKTASQYNGKAKIRVPDKVQEKILKKVRSEKTGPKQDKKLLKTLRKTAGIDLGAGGALLARKLLTRGK